VSELLVSIIEVAAWFLWLSGSIFAVGSMLWLLFLSGYARIADEAARRIMTRASMIAVIGWLAVTCAYALALSRVIKPFVLNVILEVGLREAFILQLTAFVLGGMAVRYSNNRLLLIISALLICGSFSFFGGNPSRFNDNGTVFVQGVVVQFVVAVHVIAAAFWIGALMPLRVAVASDSVATASFVIRRFQRIAFLAVPMVLTTGLAMAALLLSMAGGSIFAMANADDPVWVASLIAKFAGAIGLVTLGSLHLLRLVPAFEAGCAGASSTLAKSLGRQSLIAFGMLLLTAILATTSLPSF
jgi:copper resistance protein D